MQFIILLVGLCMSAHKICTLLKISAHSSQSSNLMEVAFEYQDLNHTSTILKLKLCRVTKSQYGKKYSNTLYGWTKSQQVPERPTNLSVHIAYTMATLHQYLSITYIWDVSRDIFKIFAFIINSKPVLLVIVLKTN